VDIRQLIGHLTEVIGWFHTTTILHHVSLTRLRQRNASAIMAEVLSFLGVPEPNWPLRTPAYVFKVVGVAVDQAISNWQQLARAFNQTRLARYIIASTEVSPTARAALEPPSSSEGRYRSSEGRYRSSEGRYRSSEGRYRVESRWERTRAPPPQEARRSLGRSHGRSQLTPSGDSRPAGPVQQLARRQSGGTSARGSMRGRGVLMQKGYQLLARARKAKQKHRAHD